MALSTYADLKASIADWLNRDDLTTQIPDFIKLAEAQFNREPAVRRVRKDTITLSAAVTVLPTDFREPLSLYHNGPTYYHSIDPTSPEELAEWNGLNGGGTGPPERCAYTENGDQLLVAPAPDGAYSAAIVYVVNLTPLSATVATNWLLTQHPDLYLYGSLVASAPFLKDDGRLPMWDSRLAAALEQLRRLKDREEYGGPIVMKIKRPIG